MGGGNPLVALLVDAGAPNIPIGAAAPAPGSVGGYREGAAVGLKGEGGNIAAAPPPPVLASPFPNPPRNGLLGAPAMPPPAPIPAPGPPIAPPPPPCWPCDKLLRNGFAAAAPPAPPRGSGLNNAELPNFPMKGDGAAAPPGAAGAAGSWVPDADVEGFPKKPDCIGALEERLREKMEACFRELHRGGGGGQGADAMRGRIGTGPRADKPTHLPLTSRRRDIVDESALRDPPPSPPPPRSLASSTKSPRPAPAEEKPAGPWPAHPLAPSGRGGCSPRDKLAASTAASRRNTLRPRAL